MRIASILTVFPSVTETFVFGDLRALEEAGHVVGLLHFIDGPEKVWQEDARALRRNVVRGGPLLSPRVLLDCAAFLLRRPLVLVSTLAWIATRRAPSPRARLKTLAILPKCVQFAADCRRWGAEHVHATWANHAAVAALVIRRLTGIPFSMSAHAGLDVFRDPVMLREKIEASRFVSVCNGATFERLREIAGEAHAGKLHRVPHGVDLLRFRPEERAAGRGTAPADDAPRILFVGRLQYGKGVPYLLAAASQLREAGRRFHLDLLGDGPDLGRVRAEIRERGLEDRVTVHGAVAQEDVARYLARAAMLVLPSEVRRDGGREGLPNAVLEAMACGVPVVASRIAALEEAVEDGTTGLLVPQRDVEALVRALGRLLDDPALGRRMADAAREVVERRYDRRRCGRRFASLFEAGA